MKKNIIIGIIGITLLITVISGCTSETTKTYENNIISFQYPENWDITSETNQSLLLQGDNGQIRLWIKDKEADPFDTAGKTEGNIENNTYFKWHVNIDDMPLSWSYMVPGDKYYIVVNGLDQDNQGVEKIVGTLKFK